MKTANSMAKHKRRTMSPEARKRIADAQRLRWAKARREAQGEAKGEANTSPPDPPDPPDPADPTDPSAMPAQSVAEALNESLGPGPAEETPQDPDSPYAPHNSALLDLIQQANHVELTLDRLTAYLDAAMVAFDSRPHLAKELIGECIRLLAEEGFSVPDQYLIPQ